MIKSAGLAVAGLTLALASPVTAATISYSLTGNFAPVGTTEVVNAAFAAVGNTANAFTETSPEGATLTIIPLDAISLTIGGITADLPASSLFFTVPMNGIGAFDLASAGGIFFGSDQLTGYDGLSEIGPVAVAFVNGQLDLGQGLTAVQGFDLTFAARLVQTVVPEPATWLMMIAGFGLAGVAMRRQRVRVRFA